MEIHDVLGILAAVVVTAAYFPYIYSTVKGKTRPNRATWFIWAVVGIVVFASYYSLGAWSTLWYAIPGGTVITALLSIRYGQGGWSRFDSLCLMGAFIALVLWFLSRSPFVALVTLIVTDFFAYLPTIKKTYADPSSESQGGWALFALAGVLNFLAIDRWTVEIAFYPIYMLSFNLLVLGLTLRKSHRA
ncbi:MAG: hypothetical protein AB1295_00360 [Candidatus Micrarchaeota archaeon]